MSWAGKKVFLTGHTGFKGAWLALWLRSKGASVSGYSLDVPTKPSLFEVAGIAKNMISQIGDVRDLEALQGAIRKCEPEVIFHLAAQSLVRDSYRDPLATYSTNVMGTANVLEASRSVPSLKAVVIITSDKCYQNMEWEKGYREGDPVGGYDPYSSSKGCAELVTAAYRNSFFSANHNAPQIASTRAGNVIGGGDWAADRLIPDVIRAWSSGKDVAIRNPKSIRPWQHVLEPLQGYLLLAEKMMAGAGFAEAWNFGPDDDGSLTVLEIVTNMGHVWGKKVAFAEVATDSLHEAKVLKLDSSKSRARLGWRPKLSISDALRLTVDWYRSFNRNENMREVTLQQIKSYEALTS